MADKIEQLRIMLGVSDFDSDILSVYLDIAEQKVLNRLYPFGIPEEAEIPERYNNNILNIACYLVNKRGAEGEVSHSENGVSRTYGSTDIPSEYLDDIIPYVKVYENEVSSEE